ncbi:MAG: leucine-rich repeat protein [Wujia sp.]
MRRRIKIIMAAAIIIIVSVLVITHFSKRADTGTDSTENVDIWEELGIAPYDESLPVIYGEEYFNMTEVSTGDIRISFNRSKEPQEPYCLIVPAKYNGGKVVEVGEIANSDYLTDIVYLGGQYIEQVSECPNLKRIVYGAIGQENYDITGQSIEWMGFDGSMVCGIYECPSIEELVFLDYGRYYSIEGIGELKLLTEVDLPGKISFMSDVFSYINIGGLELPEETIAIDSVGNYCNNLKYVVCNDKLEKINFSFISDSELEYIIIPKSVKSIEDSFRESGKVTLVVDKSSYAEQYAKEKGLNYIYTEEFDLEDYKASIDFDGYMAEIVENNSETARWLEACGNQGIMSEEEVANAIVISAEEYFTIDEEAEKNAMSGYIMDGYHYDGAVSIKLKEHIYEPYILEIPESYNGMKVTGFGDIISDPFICGIVCPDDVNMYGSINDCKNLRRVRFGRIFKSGPDNCENLTEVDTSVAEISWMAGFNNLPKLKKLVIPDTVEVLYEALGDLNLEELVIPDGVTEIVCCFARSTKLKELIIPEGVKVIGNSFVGCKDMTICVPESVSVIDDDLKMQYELFTFTECSNVKLKLVEGSYADEYAKLVGIPVEYVTGSSEE